MGRLFHQTRASPRAAEKKGARCHPPKPSVMDESSLVLTSVDDGIATLTLNRPKVRNALNAALLDALALALNAADADPQVRAIILTGSGEKAFAAGADIGELSSLASSVVGAALARRGQALTRAMELLRTPIIAAVNGFALGGGCEIAMAADIRIASEN